MSLATGERADLRRGGDVAARCAALFEAPGGLPACSGPAVSRSVGDDDIAVFVLDAGGTVYGYDKALSDAVSARHGAPDALDLALGEESGSSRLYYPRGGAVVALDAGSDAFEQVSVTTPPEGAAAWFAGCRRTSRRWPGELRGKTDEGRTRLISCANGDRPPQKRKWPGSERPSAPTALRRRSL